MDRDSKRSEEWRRLKKIAGRSNLRLFHSTKNDGKLSSGSSVRHVPDVSSKHVNASPGLSWKSMKGEASRPTKSSSPPSRPKISDPILHSSSGFGAHGDMPTISLSSSQLPHVRDIDTRNLGRLDEALHSHPPALRRQDKLESDDRVEDRERNRVRRMKERHRHTTIYSESSKGKAYYMTPDGCGELGGEKEENDEEGYIGGPTAEFLDLLDNINGTAPPKRIQSDLQVQIASNKNTRRRSDASERRRKVEFNYGEMFDQERQSLRASRAQSRKYKKLLIEEREKVKACGELWPILSAVATFYQIQPYDLEAIKVKLLETLNENDRIRKMVAPVVMRKLSDDQKLDSADIGALAPVVKQILEDKKAAEDEVVRLNWEWRHLNNNNNNDSGKNKIRKSRHHDRHQAHHYEGGFF